MRRALPLLSVFALLLGLPTDTALSERIQQGNLLASLQGEVSPLTLPRDHRAPVSIHLSGSLGTVDGSPVPRVSSMEFELAGRSGIVRRGLPVCPLRRLRHTRDREALAACGEAVVGHGWVEVQALVSDQPPLNVHARLLVFNGRTREGRTALPLHMYAEDPPVSVVVPFALRHPGEPFGNDLVAQGMARRPTVTKFSMTLSRRFFYRGSRRSYFVASCPLPPRFDSSLLSLARVGYRLQDGRHISVEIVRTCRAH
jgi:hypothetical protein